MPDLVVPPGPGLPRGLVVPASALTERFARAGGPGGQGVNTTDSRVQLSLDVASLQLTDAQSQRLTARLSGRLVGTVVTVDASEHRSQAQNRRAARERLAGLLRYALAPPPPGRRPTRPTRGSNERRLASKRLTAQKKSGRGRPSASD